jgi:hypothetical protein
MTTYRRDAWWGDGVLRDREVKDAESIMDFAERFTALITLVSLLMNKRLETGSCHMLQISKLGYFDLCCWNRFSRKVICTLHSCADHYCRELFECRRREVRSKLFASGPPAQALQLQSLAKSRIHAKLWLVCGVSHIFEQLAVCRAPF